MRRSGSGIRIIIFDLLSFYGREPVGKHSQALFLFFSGIFRGLKIKNPLFKGIYSLLAGAAGSIYRVYNRKIKNI